MTPGASLPGRRGFAATAAFLAVVAALAIAEVAVRVVQPVPRVQVLREGAGGLRFVSRGDIVLWEFDDDPLLRGTDCVGEGTRNVVLAGDSVFAGSEPGEAVRLVRDVLLTRLRARLGDHVCVVDVSQSGYVPSQQLAAAQLAAERLPVHALVLQAWKVDRRYRLIGEAAYDAEAVVNDGLGTPVGWLDLPDELHRPLFVASALWRAVTLATAAKGPTPRPFHQAYVEALDWAGAQGIPVLVAEAASMARPFAESAAGRRAALAPDAPFDPMHWAVPLQREARDRGVPYVYLADALVDRDLDAVRVDSCCHLSELGHHLVADALAPEVAALLAP